MDNNSAGVQLSTGRGLVAIFLSKIGITSSQHQDVPDYLKESFYRPHGSKEQSGWSSSRGSVHSEMPLNEIAAPSLRKISVVDSHHDQSV